LNIQRKALKPKENLFACSERFLNNIFISYHTKANNTLFVEANYTGFRSRGKK
jgi:hypothetical protein